jgi:hypothetical protein
MRPTKAPAERRSRRKLLTFSPAEWDVIAAAAAACGVTPSRYIRDAALGAAPRARAEHADLLRLVARAASALVRLAAVAETRGALPDAAAFDAARDDLLAHVREGLGLGPAPAPAPSDATHIDTPIDSHIDPSGP